MEWFNPKRKQLSRLKTWFIKPHRVRRVYKRYTETKDGQTYAGLTDAYSADIGKEETFPKCIECGKAFEYFDLAFYCITSPIRIVGYAAYEKICFECGLIRLAKITPQNQLGQLKQLALEYKE
jgi:hypothetical protein